MISIVAPAYNNPGEVKKLLESLSQSSGVTFPFEALIVDDGSKDISIKGPADPYSFARYVRLDKNSGAAAARNRGAKEAKYDSLLFFDSDVTVFPDTLSLAAKYFRDPDIKAFVGRLDMIPENKSFFTKYKAIMFNSWLPKDGHSTIFTPAIAGIRKDIFFESGGFDETIKGATVEYVKFSYELRKRCIIYFCPDLVVRVKLNSFKKALYTDFYSTMKWVAIFNEYRRFDNHCTSVSGGIGRLIGFAIVFSLPFCLIYRLYFFWAALFAAYLYLNRRFFSLILKNEAFVFLLRSILTHLVLSTVTVFGGIAGLALVLKTSIVNKRQV